MRTSIQEQILTRGRLLPGSSKQMTQCRPSLEDHEGTKSLEQYNGKVSVFKGLNKFGRKADSFAHGFREHVKLGHKITETVKGKLSLGARIIKVGGLRKVYKKLFTVKEGEKLVKASQSHLYTTSGPMPGLLFISTDKISFRSDRYQSQFLLPLEIISEFTTIKVVIPVGKVSSVNQSENVKRPSQKYIEK